jgi:hypothetical protein
VRGDLVQPRAQRGTLLEAGQVLPGCQQRLLQHILGVLQRSEHPVTMHPQLTPVRADELSESVVVSGLRPFEQVCAHSHDHPIPGSPHPASWHQITRNTTPASHVSVLGH